MTTAVRWGLLWSWQRFTLWFRLSHSKYGILSAFGSFPLSAAADHVTSPRSGKRRGIGQSCSHRWHRHLPLTSSLRDPLAVQTLLSTMARYINPLRDSAVHWVIPNVFIASWLMLTFAMCMIADTSALTLNNLKAYIYVILVFSTPVDNTHLRIPIPQTIGHYCNTCSQRRMVPTPPAWTTYASLWARPISRLIVCLFSVFDIFHWPYFSVQFRRH